MWFGTPAVAASCVFTPLPFSQTACDDPCTSTVELFALAGLSVQRLTSLVVSSVLFVCCSVCFSRAGGLPSAKFVI